MSIDALCFMFYFIMSPGLKLWYPGQWGTRVYGAMSCGQKVVAINGNSVVVQWSLVCGWAKKKREVEIR